MKPVILLVGLVITASTDAAADRRVRLEASDMAPDGHFKFPHLWPPKLLIGRKTPETQREPSAAGVT